MLAGRRMTIASNPRMNTVTAPGLDETQTPFPDAAVTRTSRAAPLEGAAEVYEFYTVALYDLDGQLIQGIDSAPEKMDGSFLPF